MANKEIQSKFKLKFEASGAPKVQKTVDKLTDALNEKSMGAGMEALAASNKHVLKQMDAMLAKTKKLSAAQSRMGGGGGGSNPPNVGGGGRGSRGGGSSPGRGAFTQGLAQGATGGEYYERGPGLGRQVVGRMVGGAARGLASSPFTGLSGFSQAVTALPGGEVVAGMLSAAMSMVQDQYGYQNAQMQLGGSAALPSGVKLGNLDKTQVSQLAKNAGLSSLDGSLRTANQQGGIQAAISAQTLGVADASTSGAFLRAGRGKGGMIGAEGRGGKALTDAIEGAFASGFDRSEVSDFLKDLAAGQADFARTGISINAESILNLSKAVTGSVAAGARANTIGAGISKAGQRIGAKGASNAYDFMMLEEIGQFDGNPENYMESRRRLENAVVTGENLKNIIKRLNGSGGAAGQQNILNFFDAQGAPISATEANRFQQGAEGMYYGDDADFHERQASRLGRLSGNSTKAVNSEAARVAATASGQQFQAGLRNDKIDIGGKVEKTLQNLEQAQMKTTQAFSNFTPAVEYLSGKILDVATGINDAAKALSQAGGQWTEDKELRLQVYKEMIKDPIEALQTSVDFWGRAFSGGGSGGIPNTSGN